MYEAIHSKNLYIKLTIQLSSLDCFYSKNGRVSSGDSDCRVHIISYPGLLIIANLLTQIHNGPYGLFGALC